MRGSYADRVGDNAEPNSAAPLHYEPFDDDHHATGVSAAEFNQDVVDRAVLFLRQVGKLRWVPEFKAYVLVGV